MWCQAYQNMVGTSMKLAPLFSYSVTLDKQSILSELQFSHVKSLIISPS